MGRINTKKQRIVAAFQYRHQMQGRSYWRLRVATDIRVPVLAEGHRHHGFVGDADTSLI